MTRDTNQLGTMLLFQRMIKDMEQHPDRYGNLFATVADRQAAWLKGEAEGRELLKLQSMDRTQAFVFLNLQPPTPMAILWLIEEARRQGKSARSSEVASRKNASERDFARKRWNEEKVANPKLSKRKFADVLVPVLARKPFHLTVSPETIAYAWLKDL